MSSANISQEALSPKHSENLSHKRRAQEEAAMKDPRPSDKRPRNNEIVNDCHPWGFHTHIGGRPYQEDAFLYARPADLQLPTNYPPTTCFGVFDGHGGHAVSTHLRNNAASYISSALQTTQNPEAALKLAFTSLDNALPIDNKDLGGSTATICLVSEREIICANCGESDELLFACIHHG